MTSKKGSCDNAATLIDGASDVASALLGPRAAVFGTAILGANYAPDGAGESKFTAKTLDRLLGVTTTARNWNTVLKLHAMSKR